MFLHYKLDNSELASLKKGVQVRQIAPQVVFEANYLKQEYFLYTWQLGQWRI